MPQVAVSGFGASAQGGEVWGTRLRSRAGGPGWSGGVHGPCGLCACQPGLVDLQPALAISQRRLNESIRAKERAKPAPSGWRPSPCRKNSEPSAMRWGTVPHLGPLTSEFLRPKWLGRALPKKEARRPAAGSACAAPPSPRRPALGKNLGGKFAPSGRCALLLCAARWWIFCEDRFGK